MTGLKPDLILLDLSLPDVARLVAAMVQARDAIGRRSWSQPQEPTSEDWWADVLADARARTRTRRHSSNLAANSGSPDEPRETVLVACSKCEWRAAFRRAELIASYGADHSMPDLLVQLAAPGCPQVGSNWDRCAAYDVEPVRK